MSRLTNVIEIRPLRLAYGDNDYQMQENMQMSIQPPYLLAFANLVFAFCASLSVTVGLAEKMEASVICEYCDVTV